MKRSHVKLSEETVQWREEKKRVLKQTWATDPQSTNHEGSYSKLVDAFSYISRYTTRCKQHLLQNIRSNYSHTHEVRKIIDLWFVFLPSDSIICMIGYLIAHEKWIKRERERDLWEPNLAWDGGSGDWCGWRRLCVNIQNQSTDYDWRTHIISPSHFPQILSLIVSIQYSVASSNKTDLLFFSSVFFYLSLL